MLLDGRRADDEIAADGQERTRGTIFVRVLEPDASARDGADSEPVQVYVIEMGECGERRVREFSNMHISSNHIIYTRISESTTVIKAINDRTCEAGTCMRTWLAP